MTDRPNCSYRDEHETCARPATLTILVGVDLELLSCDEHRNSFLMRYEAKDVAGIFPIGDEDAE